MRTSATSNYVDETHRIRVDKLLEEVRRRASRGIPDILEDKGFYVKNKAT